MTRERFKYLAEAYGAVIARWPAAEREAAALLMASEPEFARAVLADADGLDAMLDVFRPAPPSHALTEAVLASAPRPRRRGAGLGWLLPAGLGAGLAAACAAGVMVGVQLSQTSVDASDPSASASVAELDISGLSEEV